MRVFIYACEGEYQGLHGMNEQAVLDVTDLENANDIGCEMADEVISDYFWDEYDGLESDEEKNEFDEIHTREWNVWKIRDDVTLSMDELDAECERHDYQTFVELYCEEDCLDSSI